MNRVWRMRCALVLWMTAVGGMGSSQADGRYPDLSVGDSLGRVITQWGEPKEKVERELKREVVWYYAQGAYVLFQHGRVVRWRSPSTVPVGAVQPTPTISVIPVATVAVDSATRDLVREIAREIPSSPDGPSAEPPAVSAAVQPLPGNLDARSRNLVQPPPGLAPGNPVLPFEEDPGED